MAVPTRINVVNNRSISIITQGGGINYIIETPARVLYMIYIDSGTSDPSFSKSLDGGMTWSDATVLKSMSGTQISVWYDRWSGLNSDLIHVVYTDSGVDDVFYRNIDTANSDALSTEYTVFAGASTANGAAISISRMRGGNLIVVGTIDAGTEKFSRKSTNTGANWSDIADGYEASPDKCIVLPGWGADNQDAMMFYYDASASELSVKYYDDSANSWSETSIATSITIPDHTTSTNGFGQMSASVDLTNSQNLLVFWTAVDTANADLRCFKVTQSAQTETTSNVVLDSTDDQGHCCVSIFNSVWYVFYAGNSYGSDTYNTSISIYYKTSSDGGATWSSEALLENSESPAIIYLTSNPIIYKKYVVHRIVQSFYNFINCPLSIPRANYILGI